MKDNKKIIVTVGISASGKSTWAKEFVKTNPSYVRLSRDDYRYMLQDKGVCDNKIETLISDMMKVSVIKCINKNLNVIVDATHVKMEYINEVIKNYSSYADIEFKLFDTDFELCIDRDSARKQFVGPNVIDRMYDQLCNLKRIFDFQPIKKSASKKIIVDFHNPMPPAVCFDIDGTLATMGKRSPYEWDKIYLDMCNRIVAEQIVFHKSLGRKIIIMSGRDGGCKKLTEDWLKNNGITYDMFLMRAANDMRKDAIVKKELYGTYIKNKYNLLCVYDDRLQVVDMWYELGIFVFNVNQGNKEF